MKDPRSTVSVWVADNRTFSVALIVSAWLLLSNSFLWIYTGQGTYTLDEATSGGARYYSVLRYLILLLVAYRVYDLMVRNRLSGLVKFSFPFLLLIGFMASSTMWSPARFEGLRSTFLIGSQLMLGVYIVISSLDSDDVVYKLAVAGLAVVVMNLLFALALPGLARETGGFGGAYSGALRGIFVTKNVFGTNISLALIFLFFGISVADRPIRIYFIGGFLLATAMLVLSRAGAALASTLAVLSLVLGSRLMNALSLGKFERAVVSILIVFFFLAGFTIALPFLEEIVTLSGRDLTFTGRTQIWSLVYEYAARNAWFGYGISGFWYSHPDSLELIYRLGFPIGQAHNGFLEVLLQFGLVGVCIFAYLLAAAWRRFRGVWVMFLLKPKLLLVILTLFLCGALQNLFEAVWVFPIRFGLAIFGMQFASIYLFTLKRDSWQ